MKTTLSSTAQLFAASTPGPAASSQLWMLPNYLGLDAVAVAVVWQLAVARHLHVHVSGSETLALALAVFCIYLGDRLRDSFFIDARARPRHFFARTHRPVLVALLCAAGTGGILLALFSLHASLVHFGLILVPVVLLYFAWTHLRGVFTQVGCFKECAVGTIFAAGVFLAPVLRTGKLEPATLLAALAFAALCALNCLAIAHYEASPHPPSPAMPSVPALAAGAIPIVLCMALPEHRLFFSAVVVGAILLCLRILLRRSLPDHVLPLAADAALVLAGLAAWIL